MVNGSTEAAALLEKIIQKTVNMNYRVSTPTLQEMIGGKRGADRGSNAVKGFVSHFINNQIFLDFVDTVMYAQGTGNQNALVQNTQTVQQWVATALPISSSTRYDNWVKAITAKSGAAVERYTQLLIKQLSFGFKRTLNYQAWNPASNGSLATATGGSTTTTVNVALDTDRPGTRYITPGMWISIVGATGGTGTSNPSVAQVESTNSIAQTITLSQALTFTDGADILPVGPDGKATNPLTSIPQLVVNTGTVQGVDLALTSNQQAHLYSTAGSFSVPTMQQLSNECETGTPNKYFANVSVYNAMAESVLGQERTGMGNQSYLDVGYRTFTAHQGTVDVILERDMAYGALYGLWMPGWTLAILNDVYLAPLNGSMRVPGYLIYEIAMTWEGQYTNANIEANFAYTNITA